MKNIKLIAIVGFVAIALQVLMGEKVMQAATNVGSALTTNLNQDGKPINDAKLVGRKYKTVANSTTETLVCSGPCVLDSIFLSSGTAGGYIILADTTAVDGTGTVILPAIYVTGNSNNVNPLDGFPPIVTTIGLTVDASAANIVTVIGYHMK
jgi:hypothetical protein